jgi:hypothetical protein
MTPNMAGYGTNLNSAALPWNNTVNLSSLISGNTSGYLCLLYQQLSFTGQRIFIPVFISVPALTTIKSACRLPP